MRGEPLEKMRGLNEWAKGKPVGLVIMAQQLTGGAEACFEFLKLAKAGGRVEALSHILNVKRNA